MNLSWDAAQKQLAELEPIVDENVRLSAADIGRYPQHNNNGEHLSQLLANLNWYVQKFGELQPLAEQLKKWTEKRYEIEKGLEVVRIVREDGKSATFADSAKYEKVQDFLDIMVRSSALQMRVQNARSSARDTTEAIRSRIAQLRNR